MKLKLSIKDDSMFCKCLSRSSRGRTSKASSASTTSSATWSTTTPTAGTNTAKLLCRKSVKDDGIQSSIVTLSMLTFVYDIGSR